MSDAKKFRDYAQDCRRIAESMKGEDKDTLLNLAKAWEERARAIEAKKKS